MFGGAKRAPQLTAAEQLIQLSIRKRATAFVDARDDLETKIGRLSRRLNFLMTESDLWRDKFVTFESYAEKLSAEANQLRAKINKEQRETKRLSGLITLTAAEKIKLQQGQYSCIWCMQHRLNQLCHTDLRNTETAHKDAVVELERMRQTMETMEQERTEMVAEIEAQIERALMSMTAGMMEDSDYGNSRPSSRMSDATSGMRSRRTSDAGSKRPVRSLGTESTLADYDDNEIEASLGMGKPSTIAEADEEDVTIINTRRFSASDDRAAQDAMIAVDEGISVKSDNIAQKVFAIQKKVCASGSFIRDGWMLTFLISSRLRWATKAFAVAAWRARPIFPRAETLKSVLGVQGRLLAILVTPVHLSAPAREVLRLGLT